MSLRLRQEARVEDLVIVCLAHPFPANLIAHAMVKLTIISFQGAT